MVSDALLSSCHIPSFSQEGFYLAEVSKGMGTIGASGYP